jgi:hypothetical protein
VANVSAEVEARTIGASVRQPALAPGRHSDVTPYFGIPAVPSFPRLPATAPIRTGIRAASRRRACRSPSS